MRNTQFFLPFVLLLAATQSAVAQSAARGEALAEQWCSSCHLIGTDGTAGADVAPAFAGVAERMSEGALRAWLADPHPPMPKINLTTREIEDVIAYIVSLRTSAAGGPSEDPADPSKK